MAAMSDEMPPAILAMVPPDPGWLERDREEQVANGYGAMLGAMGLVMDHHGRLVRPDSEPLPCELCQGCGQCTHECACPDV